MYNNLISEYYRMIDLTGFKNSPLSYLSFCLYKCPQFDISPFIIIFGAERKGKTTLSLNIFERYYAFKYLEVFLKDRQTFEEGVSEQLKNQSISFISKTYTNYMRLNTELFMNDEGIVTADRRDAMKRANIRQLKILNVFAENNNPLLTLTQYLSDLDTRLVKRANFLIDHYRKGKDLIFMPIKDHTFINYVSTIENIKNEPEILIKENSLYNLKKLPDFIMELSYLPIAKESKLNIISKELKNDLKNELIKTI